MERKAWSKRRFLVTYWLVQGLVAYFLWPVLAMGTDARWDFVTDWSYAMWMGGSLAMIMAAQGALVMPVRPPGRESGGARWWRHLRCGMAVGAMAGYACVVAIFGLDALHRSDWLQGVQMWLIVPIVPAAVVTPVATLFFAWRCPRGTPAVLSAAIAACLAASLASGLVFAASAVSTALGPKQTMFGGGGGDEYREYWWAGTVATLFLGWIVATPLLLAFIRRGDQESALARIASRLFLGSVVEAGAVIPLDVMVRRKTDCYCGEGTLWTLTICWGVGTLVLGPAIWLVPLARRRKRWFAGRCEACGYDMWGCREAARCPECGAGCGIAAPEPASSPAQKDQTSSAK